LRKTGYVLDTNLLISYLQEEPWAKACLSGLENDSLFISVITEMEILSFPRLTPDEAGRARQILSQMTLKQPENGGTLRPSGPGDSTGGGD
jgi:predicted nucleic acid-binding protein